MIQKRKEIRHILAFAQTVGTLLKTLTLWIEKCSKYIIIKPLDCGDLYDVITKCRMV